MIMERRPFGRLRKRAAVRWHRVRGRAVHVLAADSIPGEPRPAVYSWPCLAEGTTSL